MHVGTHIYTHTYAPTRRDTPHSVAARLEQASAALCPFLLSLQMLQHNLNLAHCWQAVLQRSQQCVAGGAALLESRQMLWMPWLVRPVLATIVEEALLAYWLGVRQEAACGHPLLAPSPVAAALGAGT